MMLIFLTPMFAHSYHKFDIPQDLCHIPCGFWSLFKQKVILEAPETNHTLDLTKLFIFFLKICFEVFVRGRKLLSFIDENACCEEEEL